VEKANWTGICVACPREAYTDIRTSPEFARGGIYILLGEEENGVRLYVGEADLLARRLDQHVKEREFWDRLVAFTTRDNSHNKAHLLYLEARLLDLAKSANQAELDNTQFPAPPELGRDREDLEAFLDDVLLLLPLVGVGEFAPLDERAERDSETLQAPIVDLVEGIPLVLDMGDVRADGVLLADDRVTVRQGSTARLQETPLCQLTYQRLRQRLKDEAVLTVATDGQSLQFARDHTFTSPSAAAAVVIGHGVNGRAMWRTVEGRSINDLQALTVAQQVNVAELPSPPVTVVPAP
jgi:hypothetical protein